jgi:high-affinity K+ transport system ATPase subunit B
VVGLRFWGKGLAVEPLHLLAQRFIRLIWLLVVVLAVTGLLLIVAEPHRTLGNPVFYLKMVLLLVAIVITAWLSSVSTRQHDRVSGAHRIAAALTVLLWIGIMFAGRFIAYYDPY